MLELGDQIILHPSISEQLVDKSELKFNHAVIDTVMRKSGWNWKDLIIMEDNDWIIRNKPAGIVAHEGNKHTEDITMNQLLEHYISQETEKNKDTKKSKIGGQQTNPLQHRPPVNGDKRGFIEASGATTFKPSFGFRLDKDTTGILVSAKTYPALQHINQIIRDHDITKIYLAWIIGKPDLATIAKNYGYDFDGTHLAINEPLFKGFNAKTERAQTFVNTEKGLPSQTIISIQKTVNDPHLGYISLIQCRLLSGRMHQIRAHMAYIGYAVLGDITYGNPVTNKILHKNYKINRQLLHSYQYSFTDMNGKKIEATAPIPHDFEVL